MVSNRKSSNDSYCSLWEEWNPSEDLEEMFSENVFSDYIGIH